MARLNQQDVQAIRNIVAEVVSGEIDSRQKREAQILAQIVADCYRTMMEQESREVAQAHGRMLETAAMIEDIAARGELDVSTLGEEANKRAYALAVAMAERAVVHAENALIKIKELIEQAQLGVAKGGMINAAGSWRSSSEWKVALKHMIESEKMATERLETERKRLSNLKLSERGLKLIK